ncbi:glycosyltransferase family 39 protein, partial [Candidatus Curtissbacteria bacterium]|nr:glycosyltransferase family 39 protein [Candidatus Curtissbacteria bacterium]
MAQGKRVEEKSRLSTFFTKRTIILILILAAGAILRLYSLNTVPPGFHRDEALFGYDAYSLLKTGHDQHGRFLPLSFEGFGISEYPMAFYLKVPFIALMGLNVFSVRFSVVFISIITIFLIYKLAKRFFQDEATALLCTFVAAFSSWHFFMSRPGYSIGMYGLMFLLLGTYLIFGKTRRQTVIGGICLGLTCFSYAAYFFFLPLFLPLVFGLFWKELKTDKNKRWGIATAFLVMLLAFAVFWLPNLKRAPQAAFWADDARGILFQWSDKPVGEI